MSLLNLAWLQPLLIPLMGASTAWERERARVQGDTENVPSRSALLEKAQQKEKFAESS